ncbi:MAG TPA: hypothetical protein VIG40_01385 [Tissierellaceae bacterium]
MSEIIIDLIRVLSIIWMVWKLDKITQKRIDNIQWSIDILLNRIEELEGEIEDTKRDN